MTRDGIRRVALFAFDCEPGAGSDPGLGWQWLLLAAENNHVVVFTQQKNIDQLQRQGLPDHVELRGIQPWNIAMRLGPNNPGGEFLRCRNWLTLAIKQASREHQQTPFDVAHFATFSAFWMPGPFYRLKVPFLFAVMTGGEQTHEGFPSSMRSRLQLRRKMFHALMRTPSWRKSLVHSPALMVGATEVVGDFATRSGAKNVAVFRPPFTLEPGLASTLEDQRLSACKSSAPTYVVTGRLLGWKGQEWALRAMAEVVKSKPDAHLHVIGDGPQAGSYQHLAEQLALGKSVTFHGRISRQAERSIIANSTALVFPSERDAGAAVLSFAMALGTPIVGFDVGAARQVVGQAAKLVSPATNPSMELAEAMLELANDSKACEELAQEGTERIKSVLSWPGCQASLERWYTRAEEIFSDAQLQSP